MGETRRLWNAGSVALVWLPLLAITVLHYGAPHHAIWVHDIARRLFYLPIVFAAVRGGVSAGLLATAVVLVAYMPHAFLLEMDTDPASVTQKILEMGFYVVLAVATGWIAERLERQRESLARHEAALQRAARLESLGQLTAGLAHEIRNPLHAMRGTAEILLDHVPAGIEERDLAEAHLAEIDRLSGVLKRFLDFARQGSPTVGPVRLGDVVERVGSLIRAQASQQGTALRVDRGDDRTVPADFDLLVQATLAIALNALQAVDERGAVTLTTGHLARDGRNHGVIAVHNDGPPLPPEIRERLFDPFVSTREGGTGLGLAAAWRIARDHDGRVEAEDVPGGVTFRILLPT